MRVDDEILEGRDETLPVAWCEDNVPEDVARAVFTRANFCCQVCGAEMGRSILRRLATWQDPTAWVEFGGAAVRERDDHIIQVRLVVWAPEWPWEGPESGLEARCMGCVIRTEVAKAPRYAPPKTKAAKAAVQPRGRQVGLFT